MSRKHFPVKYANKPSTRNGLFRSLQTHFFLYSILSLLCFSSVSYSQDLPEIQKAGVLRHLGIPYANFVTGSGDGLSIELIKGFATSIGVEYIYIASDWGTIFGDLTGRHARRGAEGAILLEKTEIRGDIIETGMTMLPWRRNVIIFSEPTFPSSVWLLAHADANLQPIKPSGSIESDIIAVKNSLNGHTVLALKNTCLDPFLYHMAETKAQIILPNDKLQLNELAPAVLAREAESTLLDAPDALIALQKWPGQLKVIGPVSSAQVMGAGFRKDSPQLLKAFNRYLKKSKSDGSYNRMVKKYYPSVFSYYADFFKN